MTANRAARLQFAISELVDILAEDLTARTVAAIAKQESIKALPVPVPAQSDTEPRQRRLLRRAEVEERTSLRKSTIYKWIQQGKFPAPVPLGDKTAVWLESDIEAWIDAKIATRDAT